jgi:putative membrane protein
MERAGSMVFGLQGGVIGRRAPYRAWLAGIFLVALAASCINPRNAPDLFIEHVLTVGAFSVGVVEGIRRPLRNTSYTLLLAFLLLHVLGAHYTYSEVPYQEWARHLLGDGAAALQTERNHFDRLVHFSFGLLAFPAARDVSRQYVRVAGRWSFVVAALILHALSTTYELLEWLLTLVVAPEQAEIYNGQQGDVWDAHKDVAWATLGMALGIVVDAAWLATLSAMGLTPTPRADGGSFPVEAGWGRASTSCRRTTSTPRPGRAV